MDKQELIAHILEKFNQSENEFNKQGISIELSMIYQGQMNAYQEMLNFVNGIE